MKKIILIICLLFSLHSNGQTKNPVLKDTSTSSLSKHFTGNIGSYRIGNNYTENQKLMFMSKGEISAYQKAGSDTLVIVDSVLNIYDFKIRYIKIGDKVYPLNPKQ